MRRTYGLDEARNIARELSIDFNQSPFDLEQFRAGLDVEAEHGEIDPETNVTNDDPLTTGRIALAHLNEIPDYYTRLKKMETEADAQPQQATSQADNPRSRGAFRFLPLVALPIGALFVRFWTRRRSKRA
jgi:hypothetical protein